MQSDLWKKLSPEARKADMFLADYENLATRQGLLELLQHNANIDLRKNLRVVTPAGKLQQTINDNNSSIYKTIYDNRVPSAIEKATGYKPIPTGLKYPYTPIHSEIRYDTAAIQKDIDMLAALKDDTSVQEKFFLEYMVQPYWKTRYVPSNIPTRELTRLEDAAEYAAYALVGRDRNPANPYYDMNLRNLLTLLVNEQLERKHYLDKAANYKPPPV